MSSSNNNNRSPVLIVGVTAAVSSFIGGYLVRWLWEQRRQRQAASTTAKAEAHLWKVAEYALTAAMLQAADALGLFELLATRHDDNSTPTAGAITSQELARQQNWNERWLREVLLQLTGAKICKYHADSHQFSLRPEYVAILRDPDFRPKDGNNNNNNSLAAVFPFVGALTRRSDAVVRAVQTGQGITYDDDGNDINVAIHRKNQNFFRYTLVDKLLPSLTIPQTGDRLMERLHAGICVADVGCGYGASTLAMARQFPRSHFYAYESSPTALAALRKAIAGSGGGGGGDGNGQEAAEGAAEKLDNVTVCDVSQRTVGDGPDVDDPRNGRQQFEFVYAHDVLHDMTNPRQLIKDVKARLCPQRGCWFIVDTDCSESMEQNVHHPKAGMLYAYSCLLCLSSSTSEPNGEGLGTCGFPPTLAKRWMHKAGFQHVEQMKFAELPDKACYLVA